MRRVSPRHRSCEVWEPTPRRSIFDPPPGASLHPARSSRRCVRLLTETVSPSDQWTIFQHTLDQPGDSPHHSTPEDSKFSGFAWLVRPLNEAYLHRSEKTRDKDLKKHGGLDHQAHSLSLPGLGFLIVTTWVTIMWVSAMTRSAHATEPDEPPWTGPEDPSLGEESAGDQSAPGETP